MKEFLEALTDLARQGAERLRQLNEGGAIAGTLKMVEKPQAPEKISDDVPASRKEKKGKPAKEAAGPTDEELEKMKTDRAKLLVTKHGKLIDGKPEGFYIAKHLLIEEFQVGRLADLKGAACAGFVKRVDEILADDALAAALLERSRPDKVAL